MRARQRSTPVRRGRLRQVEQPSGRTETKHEKFRRVASLRVHNAVETLRLVKKLGDREFYEFDETEANTILRKLLTEVYDVQEALFGGGKTRRDIFVEPTSIARHPLLDDIPL